MIASEDLDALIEGLQQYKDQGVVDPWLLSDGTIIEPLDVLIELQALRLSAIMGFLEWRDGVDTVQSAYLQDQVKRFLRRKQ